MIVPLACLQATQPPRKTESSKGWSSSRPVAFVAPAKILALRLDLALRYVLDKDN